MIKATYSDKAEIVDILSKSFIENKSVSYVVKGDKKKHQRIRHLMDYSFEQCWNWGEVFMSEDKNGAALILNPQLKKNNLKAVKLDIKLALKSIGLTRVLKVLSRESIVKKLHPSGQPYLYFWFLGVNPENQSNGIGSSLMADIVKESDTRNIPIYLETSTLRNLPLYERFGFKTYKEVNLGYILHCMKREPEVQPN